jgi:hypothetical protein
MSELRAITPMEATMDDVESCGLRVVYQSPAHDRAQTRSLLLDIALGLFLGRYTICTHRSFGITPIRNCPFPPDDVRRRIC